MRAAALALAAMMVGVMLLLVMVVSDCDRSALRFPHPVIRGCADDCRAPFFRRLGAGSHGGGSMPVAWGGLIYYKYLRVFSFSLHYF